MINERGLALIKHFEGFASVPYLCPAGVITWGYGHARKKGEKVPASISEKEAEELLMEDVAVAAKAVADLPIKLNEDQTSALVAFVFNVGGGAFQKSTLLKRILQKDPGASDEFLKWVWGGGKILPGLIRRRCHERALFLSESWESAEERYAQELAKTNPSGAGLKPDWIGGV